jgi:hypothetical protein
VIKKSAPYEITRLGWGEFEVTANVVLKHGYHWINSDAKVAPGTRKSMLAMVWMLNFEGGGAQGRARFKVRRERRARNRGERAVTTSALY